MLLRSTLEARDCSFVCSALELASASVDLDHDELREEAQLPGEGRSPAPEPPTGPVTGRCAARYPQRSLCELCEFCSIKEGD